MHVTLATVYRGDKLHGEMDSLLVADAIKGTVDFVAAATKIAYGADAIGRGRVHAFKESSFEIQQVFEIARDSAGIAATVLPLLPPIDDIKPLLTLLKSGFDLLKHLKGEKPKKLNYADNGSVVVENNSGVVNVYNNSTINLVMNTDASRSSQKFVGNPVSTEADEVEVKLESKTVLHAGRHEAECFRDVTAKEPDNVSRRTLELRVIQPVLEGQAQWRFSDGGRSSFVAKIEDSGFLTRVAEGMEKFGRGDRIEAKVRAEQSRGPRGGLKMRYFVEQVVRRVPKPSELPL